jgi:serine/threonine protein kinase
MKDSFASSSFTGTTRRPVIDPGTLLQGRYRVIRRLGKGGMGAVYEAIDSRLDVTVAIKEGFSTDPRLRKQFEHEARLLAQLHHSALPRVTDYFIEDNRVFLVMQFIGGDDVAEIIAKQPGPLPSNTVIAWADQLLDALIYLHTRERQIIHRDIKPHNLKLTSAGSIALLDFGLAKADFDSTGANSWTSVFGFTRRYSPPEQMQDQGTTPRSDIYALGATLYHLLTGVKPPDALVRTKAIAKSQPDPLLPANQIHSAVGPEVAAILQKALELNPELRYENASEFRQALRQVGRNPETAGRALDNWTETHSDASGPPNVNVTVVNKTITFDPFDSYSILRPAERDWLIPRPSRRPLLIAALLVTALVGGVVAFASDEDWASLSTEAINYVQPGRDSMKTNSPSPARIEVTRVRDQSSVSRISASAKDAAREQNLRKPQNTNSANKNKPLKNTRGK